MNFRRSILACCLACAIVPGWASDMPAKKYKVMMMLFRGVTDAELGFMDYFKRHQIPVEFIVRDAEGDKNKIATFVSEARKLHPDLIYTFGTTVTSEVVGPVGHVDPAINITDIPVVFDIVADPVGANLVTDLKSSSRNLTGAMHLVPLEAQVKALQTMRKTDTLGVIYNPQEKNSQLTVSALEKLASTFHMKLQLAPVGMEANGKGGAADLNTAMQNLLAKRPQFIYMPSDSFIIKNAKQVVAAAQAAHVPVFSATETPIRKNGALFGVVSNYYNVGAFSAYKAEQILINKTPPARIPIESLNRFTYLVNMESARRLAIYPPLSVLKLAETIDPLDVIDVSE